MLGVVLWSDTKQQKAIIWCEDQGDLAYYGSSEHSVANMDGIGEGDLIQFDLAEAKNLRLAKNIKRIAEHYCSDIKGVVQQVSQVSKDILQEKSNANLPNTAPTSGQGALVNLSAERSKRSKLRLAGAAAR